MIASMSLKIGSSKVMGRMFSFTEEVMIEPAPATFSIDHTANSLADGGRSSSARHVLMKGSSHSLTAFSSRSCIKSAVTRDLPTSLVFLKAFNAEQQFFYPDRIHDMFIPLLRFRCVCVVWNISRNHGSILFQSSSVLVV